MCAPPSRPLRQQLSVARLHLLHTPRHAAHAASLRTHPGDCSQPNVAGHVRRQLIYGQAVEGLHYGIVLYISHPALSIVSGMVGVADKVIIELDCPCTTTQHLTTHSFATGQRYSSLANSGCVLCFVRVIFCPQRRL